MEKEPIKHIFVPEHTILSQKEKDELLETYNFSEKQLPKILKKDAGITHLDVKSGDVIKIRRNSPVIGESVFYRIVT